MRPDEEKIRPIRSFCLLQEWFFFFFFLEEQVESHWIAGALLFSTAGLATIMFLQVWTFTADLISPAALVYRLWCTRLCQWPRMNLRKKKIPSFSYVGSDENGLFFLYVLFTLQWKSQLDRPSLPHPELKTSVCPTSVQPAAVTPGIRLHQKQPLIRDKQTDGRTSGGDADCSRRLSSSD